MTAPNRDAAYALRLWPPMVLPVVCAGCKQPYVAGHVCPTLRDLSPFGGGPNPWGGRAR